MAEIEDILSTEQLLAHMRAAEAERETRVADLLVLLKIEKIRRDLPDVKDSVKEVGDEPQMIVRSSSIYRRVGKVSRAEPAQQSGNSSTNNTRQQHASSANSIQSENNNLLLSGTSQNQDPDQPPPEQDESAEPTPPPPAPADQNASGVPQLRLSRNITTVADLWREWTEGIEVKPPIQELEDQCQSS